MRTIIKIAPSSISKFASVPDKVSGIAYSFTEKTVGFFCFETGDIGFIVDGEIKYVSRRLEIPSPMGISCDSLGFLVFQLSPNLLWGFDQSFGGGSTICGNKVYADLMSFASFGTKSAVPVAMCRISNNTAAVAVPLSNKIVSINTTSATVLIGCGKKVCDIEGI